MRSTAAPAAAAAITAVFLLVGCGDDDSSSPTAVSSSPTESTTTASPTTAAPTTDPPATDVQYPTDGDVLLVGVTTGYGTLPDLMIAGDGAVYAPEDSPNGLAYAPPPGPAPQPVVVRHLTPEGLDAVMTRAMELGLLDTPPEYEHVEVTDSGTTNVTLRDDDGEYSHSAYALGFDEPEQDPDRRRLDEFVTDVADLESLVGAENISDPEPYVPERWLVTTAVALTSDPEPWPFDTPASDGCLSLDGVPTEEIPGGYEASVDGERVNVSVVPAFPWTEC